MMLLLLRANNKAIKMIRILIKSCQFISHGVLPIALEVKCGVRDPFVL